VLRDFREGPVGAGLAKVPAKHFDEQFEKEICAKTRAIMAQLQPGNPYRRGRLSTVDLLVIANLNRLLLILNTSFTFSQNKLP